MLPGYLFLRHAMDKASYIEVRQARGLVRILGERWDCLAVVSEAEIVTLATVMHSHPPARHYPYLREGQRVRITHGPLAGVEGIFVQSKAHRGLVVLSIELLQRSVAVEVDYTLVVAV
jgi:transcription antitermination factor NusG